MSKSTALKSHVELLDEIKTIINALKNLALMEINKVEKLSDTQKRVMDSLIDVAADFFKHYPSMLESLTEDSPSLYVLVGSERGFCSNFNDMAFNFWQEKVKSEFSENVQTVAVGRKIAIKLEEAKSKEPKNIAGANSTEEITNIISNILNELDMLFKQSPEKFNPARWAIIFNSQTEHGVIEPKMLMPFAVFKNATSKNLTEPPFLYLKPHEFLRCFVSNYLFAALLHASYDSFAAENRQRFRHMESALEWIDKKRETMKKQKARLSKEEITEAIELILLSTENT